MLHPLVADDSVVFKDRNRCTLIAKVPTPNFGTAQDNRGCSATTCRGFYGRVDRRVPGYGCVCVTLHGMVDSRRRAFTKMLCTRKRVGCAHMFSVSGMVSYIKMNSTFYNTVLCTRGTCRSGRGHISFSATTSMLGGAVTNSCGVIGMSRMRNLLTHRRDKRITQWLAVRALWGFEH